MSRTLLFLVALGLVVAKAPSVMADDTDVNSSTFNPFSPEEETTFQDRAPAKSSTRSNRNMEKDSSEGGGFTWPSYLKPKLPTLPKPSMPKLSMPSWASPSSSDTKPKMRGMEEPSTWEKLNNGTKNLLTNTKNTLMPWTVEEKKESPIRSSSTSRQRTTTRTASRSKGKTEKKSILSSWFSPKEEEKPIETVNDYLSLPRPY